METIRPGTPLSMDITPAPQEVLHPTRPPPTCGLALAHPWHTVHARNPPHLLLHHCRSGSQADGYRANLWLRCAIRVLSELGGGQLQVNEAAGRTGAVAVSPAAGLCWERKCGRVARCAFVLLFPSKTFGAAWRTSSCVCQHVHAVHHTRVEILLHFPLPPPPQLYELVRDCGVRWEEVLPPGATFSIEPRLWSCTGDGDAWG